MKKLICLTLLLFILSTMMNAQYGKDGRGRRDRQKSEVSYPPLNLITIPTAGTLPRGIYTLEIILQNGGGVLPKLTVGVTNNFCIGLSYGIQNLIGDQKPKFNRDIPEVQIKYRILEEKRFPALVIGLDSQGKGEYQSEGDYERYEQKAWGLYLAASKNWEFFGDTGLHFGINKNTWEDDDDDDLNLFFGLDKTINKSISFLLEYNAAFNDDNKENDDLEEFDDMTFGRGRGYLNAGIRFKIAKNFTMELDLNNVNLNNKDVKYTNREIKIMFTESF